MKHRQMSFLFFCNFVIFLTGGSLLPLLPLYATEFGMSSSVIGIYLAVIFAAIAAGTMVTGWLAERLTHKALFIGSGLLGVPALVLLGQVSAVWHVIVLTTLVWFVAGIGTAQVSVFVGVTAISNRRGKSFGLMFLARPLGGVIGGLAAGQVVAWSGYPLLFILLGVIWAGWPLIGLLGMDYRSLSIVVTTTGDPAKDQPTGQSLGRPFYLLLAAALLSTTVVYIGRLGTSISMQMLDFSPGAVGSTSAVGSLVMIPVTLLIGPLSDRLGRKGLLMLSYALAGGGAWLLMSASELWQFSLAMVVMFITNSANGSVAAAYATDLLDSKNLGRGLPWLQAMTWSGGVIGFAGAGYVMDTLGLIPLYLLAAVLGITAAALLGLMFQRAQTVAPAGRLIGVSEA